MTDAIKEYRVLVELDEDGQPMESVAISDEDDNIVTWVGTPSEAYKWIKDNGKLAVKYEMSDDGFDEILIPILSEENEREIAEEFLQYLINNSNHIHTLYADKFYKNGAWNVMMDAIDNVMKHNLSVAKLNRFTECKYFNNTIEAWISDQDISY